jgi:hypothetical protein
MMKIRFYSLFAFACLVLHLGQTVFPVQEKADLLPISSEEFALRNDPINPGAPAILLHRETHVDAPISFASYYLRIKILTDERSVSD